MGIRMESGETCECGNKDHFWYDVETQELICLVCGLVVEEWVWRENHYAGV